MLLSPPQLRQPCRSWLSSDRCTGPTRIRPPFRPRSRLRRAARGDAGPARCDAGAANGAAVAAAEQPAVTRSPSAPPAVASACDAGAPASGQRAVRHVRGAAGRDCSGCDPVAHQPAPPVVASPPSAPPAATRKAETPVAPSAPPAREAAKAREQAPVALRPAEPSREAAAAPAARTATPSPATPSQPEPKSAPAKAASAPVAPSMSAPVTQPSAVDRQHHPRPPDGAPVEALRLRRSTRPRRRQDGSAPPAAPASGSSGSARQGRAATAGESRERTGGTADVRTARGATECRRTVHRVIRARRTGGAVDAAAPAPEQSRAACQDGKCTACRARGPGSSGSARQGRAAAARESRERTVAPPMPHLPWRHRVPSHRPSIIAPAVPALRRSIAAPSKTAPPVGRSAPLPRPRSATPAPLAKGEPQPPAKAEQPPRQIVSTAPSAVVRAASGRHRPAACVGRASRIRATRRRADRASRYRRRIAARAGHGRNRSARIRAAAGHARQESRKPEARVAASCCASTVQRGPGKTQRCAGDHGDARTSAALRAIGPHRAGLRDAGDPGDASVALCAAGTADPARSGLMPAAPISSIFRRRGVSAAGKTPICRT